MKKRANLIWVTIVIVFMAGLCMFSCSGSSGGGGGGGTGVLGLLLTDAATSEYQAAYVTIEEIKVLSVTEAGTGEWTTVATPDKTYNLLELINGVMESLGSATLPAGEYEEMRLVLGTAPDSGDNILGAPHPYANYVIDAYDDVYELTLPDGYEDGYQVGGEFVIKADTTTTLVLDFSVIKSIVQAGSNGQWFLNPTINMLDMANLSELTGTITDSVTDEPLEGVLVSAQQTSEDGSMEIVAASTVSDDTGGYTLMLAPGTYSIVAGKTGYVSATADVTVEFATNATRDFALEAGGGEGSITGTVIIDKGKDEQFISVSIRQTITEDGADNTVEVAFLSVANGGQYTFDLPPGTYSLVAVFKVDGIEMTLETGDSFVVEDGTVIEFDIVFSNEVSVEGDGSGWGNPGKVTVCHKGKEIRISRSALKAHLRHGDVEGECGVEQPGDDSSSTGQDDTGGEDNTGDGGETATTPDKVAVCHKGRVLYVSQTSVNAHLKHGDVLGDCTTASHDDDSTETDDE